MPASARPSAFISTSDNYPPACPKCGQQMRFQKVYPAVQNVKQDEYFYTCDCGEKLSRLLERD
jgi:hypothetical protein